MMARGVGSLPLLLLLVSALHQPAVAQWGQRFSLAAGPAIVVQDAPPYAGVHVRAAAALLRRVRTFNLLADGYLTWPAPGTGQLIFTAVSVDRRVRETQFKSISSSAWGSPFEPVLDGCWWKPGRMVERPSICLSPSP
jgi:hypothetical protein